MWSRTAQVDIAPTAFIMASFQTLFATMALACEMGVDGAKVDKAEGVAFAACSPPLSDVDDDDVTLQNALPVAKLPLLPLSTGRGSRRRLRCTDLCVHHLSAAPSSPAPRLREGCSF